MDPYNLPQVLVPNGSSEMPWGKHRWMWPGGDLNYVGGEQRRDRWANRVAYTLNADPFRPRRRSSITGRLREPPTYSIDFGIGKNFPVTGRVKFQSVNDWINAINTPQWYGSTGTCNTASKSCFGQIANQQTQSNLPCQIQLAGRITY